MNPEKKENYQHITNTIAREAGIQGDNRMYHDPIHQSWMEGDFYRGLLRTERMPVLRLFFSLFILIIPSVFALILFTWQAMSVNEGKDTLGLVFVYFYSGLVIFVGVKILISAIQTLRKKHKKL
jgi:hypothetical protein